MQFALTIFLSAFLLFQVQPVIAKYVLPWYGGSPSVWTTCMLFFQVLLLGGYAYAHLIVSRFGERKQIAVHSVLLVLSLLMLPITPESSLKPTGLENPTWGIIKLLLVTIGLPYLMVASTGPLLQHWYSCLHEGKSPYRLYALSNLGSLLGLLTYPFLVEPVLRLQSQTLIWSVGYAVFVVLCGASGWMLYRAAAQWKEIRARTRSEPRSRVNAFDAMMWVALTATGSVILLASTNYICQDIAVIPFLWIVPLSLYLVTFIIAFDSPRWYIRWIWIPLLFVSVGSIMYLMATDTIEDFGITHVVALFSAAMFCSVMVCHGELVRLKPPVEHLTAFYLMVAFGGALGGALVNFVAPQVFNGWWEFQLGFILAFILAGILILRRSAKIHPVLRAAGIAVFLAAIGGMTKITLDLVEDHNDDVEVARRNFYGVLRVVHDEIDDHPTKKLYYGGINHGMQFQEEDRRLNATTYYAPWSGIGVAIHKHPKKLRGDDGPRDNIRVGVIGLGTGTLSSYSRTGDQYRIYEINPAVQELATSEFTYVNDAEGNVELIMGDGRISLERELAETGSNHFDVFAVDAFSGDAIPIHLLTVEAVKLYFEHLAPGGILAIHVSNRHLALEPIVEGIAQKLGKNFCMVESNGSEPEGVKSSSWALMTDNEDFINHPEVTKYISPWPDEGPPQVWTDDYSSLVNILKDD